MEDRETSQQLKLTLRKPNKIIILSIIGVAIITIGISSGQLNSCGIKHVALVNDINTFEKNGDPEFCALTVEKILEFNDQCEPYIEILDCG